MGMNGKRFLAVVMAAAFALTAFVVAPVAASAAAGSGWSANSNSSTTKFSTSPQTGVFVIEHTEFTSSDVRFDLELEPYKNYIISVEAKVENFISKDKDPQYNGASLFSHWVEDKTDRYCGSDFTHSGEWTTISMPIRSLSSASAEIRLNLRDCKGKATFRNLKISLCDTLAIKTGKGVNVKLPRIASDTDLAKYIKDYGLEAMPGGVSFANYAEVQALLTERPEVIRAGVKTVADVIIFMIADKIELCDGDFMLGTWHYNLPAKRVLEVKMANCGDCANLTKYLLEGDYEEVGFFQGNDHDGGGHTWNYVKFQGKYYSVDLTQRIWEPGVSPVVDDISVTALSEFGKVKPWHFIVVAAYNTAGIQLPVSSDFVYTADKSDFETIMYLPKSAKFTVLYEQPGVGGAVMRGKDVAIIPELDWTKTNDELPLGSQTPVNVPLNTPTFAADANVTNLDVPAVMPKPDPNAPKVGTKIGDVLFTDIKAYINGSQIPACNIGGSMYIFAADLRNYGFDVQYDNATRSTTIKLDKGKAFAPLDVAKTSGSVGAKIGNVLYTDIKTYINGKEVTSVNVDGKTAIPFAELKAFGEVKYDNATRSSTLTIK